MRKWIIGVAMVLALLTLGGGAALAALQSPPETSTKGTVTWDSSFQDPDYTLGNTVTMTVTWSAASGTATYDSFVLKRYTPKGGDPATGTVPTATSPGSGGASSVDVSFQFDGLHLDKKCNREIGNAHFKLYLMVDEDGGGPGQPVKKGYGVNVHVEDPLNGTC